MVYLQGVGFEVPQRLELECRAPSSPEAREPLGLLHGSRDARGLRPERSFRGLLQRADSAHGEPESGARRPSERRFVGRGSGRIDVADARHLRDVGDRAHAHARVPGRAVPFFFERREVGRCTSPTQ